MINLAKYLGAVILVGVSIRLSILYLLLVLSSCASAVGITMNTL